MNDDVPLVVAEVNPQALGRAPRNHRQPQLLDHADGRRAQAAARPSRHRAPGHQYLPGRLRHGQARRRRAARSSHALLHERAIDEPSRYAHQIAFNALPHAGSFAAGDDHTDEERKLINETRKILDDPAIASRRHACACPSSTGTQRPSTCRPRAALARAGARAAGRRARRDGARRSRIALYPLAIDASGQDDVFVGRIRREPGTSARWTCGSSSDNLRKGAATNAVQLAELLVGAACSARVRARSPQAPPSSERSPRLQRADGPLADPALARLRARRVGSTCSSPAPRRRGSVAIGSLGENRQVDVRLRVVDVVADRVQVGAHGQEGCDHARVELAAGGTLDLRASALDGPGLLVGAVVRQRVEHVGDGDDPSDSGIASPCRPFG